MYWIYLAIFVAMVFTPHFVGQGNTWLAEEDLESFVIFSLGILGFVIYLSKEKALIRIIKEKLLLQKQTHIITRDLSDSYSYIGELNRKFDIVKNLAFQLPKSLGKNTDNAEDFYHTLLEAVSLLAKCDSVELLIIRLKEKQAVWSTTFGPPSDGSPISAEALVAPGKNFWEDGEYLIARSPKEANGLAAFLVFPKRVNALEDADIFKIFAAEALFLYCARERFIASEPQAEGV